MPSGRGPATPLGIGVTGTSGVNIVAKSPDRFCFFPSLGETPLRGFSLRSTLCILCTQSVLKALLLKKLFIFLRLRQHFGRLWGQSGELLGPGRHKRRRWRSPKIGKWWIIFFKGLCRGGGSSPGRSAAASCKLSLSSGGRALSPSFFFLSMAENMICVESGDPPPSTAIRSDQISRSVVSDSL